MSNIYKDTFEDMLISYRTPALTLQDLGLSSLKLRLKPASPQEKLGLKSTGLRNTGESSGMDQSSQAKGKPGTLSPEFQNAVGQVAGQMISKGTGNPVLGKAAASALGVSKTGSSKGYGTIAGGFLGGLFGGPAGAKLGAKLGGLIGMLGNLLDNLDIDVGLTTKLSVTSEFSVEGEGLGDPSAVGGYGNPGIGVGGVGIGGQGMVGEAGGLGGDGDIAGGGFGVGPR